MSVFLATSETTPLKEAGKVESLGRGPGAPWRKRGSTPEKR